MKISARGIAAFHVFLVALLLAVAGAALAQMPSKSLKEQLVGHWRLASISLNDSTESYGDNPQGSMFADAAGHYSVIVISTGGARNVSLFGTYTVDDADGSVTLHIDATNITDAVGRDVKRFVAVNGDQLTVTSKRSAGPVGPLTMLWKRAN
jgi:hypothetical protein